MMFIEEVRGTIIGGDNYSYYEFWTVKNTGYPQYLGPHRFAKGWFSDDEDAEQWVKENHPEHYKDGVEMRCFED